MNTDEQARGIFNRLAFFLHILEERRIHNNGQSASSSTGD
jgi:hypothetical protein